MRTGSWVALWILPLAVVGGISQMVADAQTRTSHRHWLFRSPAPPGLGQVLQLVDNRAERYTTTLAVVTPARHHAVIEESLSAEKGAVTYSFLFTDQESGWWARISEHTGLPAASLSDYDIDDLVAANARGEVKGKVETARGSRWVSQGDLSAEELTAPADRALGELLADTVVPQSVGEQIRFLSVTCELAASELGRGTCGYVAALERSIAGESAESATLYRDMSWEVSAAPVRSGLPAANSSEAFLLEEFPSLRRAPAD